MTGNQNQQLVLFERGADIEVRPDDEGFAGSWYEATILSIIHTPYSKNPNPNSKNPNPNTFHYEVEYKQLLAEDESSSLKEIVRIDFVRPLPPQQPHPEEFRLDDVVEAFHQEGRWIGIITKVIRNKKDKLFEVTFTNPPDQIRFRASDLRPHLNWIDGKWVRPPPTKKLQQVGKSEDQATGSMKRKGRTTKTHSKSPASSTGGIDTAEGQEMDLTINQITTQLRKNKGTPAKTPEVNEGLRNGINSVTIANRPKRVKTQATPVKTVMHTPKRRKTGITDSSIDNVSNKAINVEKEEGSKGASKVGIAAGKRQSLSSSNASDTRPLSLWFAGPCSKRNCQELTGSKTANGSVSVEHAVASTAVVEGNGGEVINPNKELEIVERAGAVEKIGEKIIGLNNQNLEITAVAVSTAVMTNVDDPNNEKRCEQVLAVTSNAMDLNDQILPFVKTFPLWNQIESMQIFEAIPQRPHFRTLLDACPENCREGMAIGYMVTFTSVVNKVNTLRLDDPKSSIEDCLETLAQLEQNGFGVKVIRDRLHSLLSKKDEYFVLLDQLKIHESQIMEHNRGKEKIVEEVDELDKQIKELLEKRNMAILMGENVKKEIACFESKLKSANQDINKNRYNFKQSAGAPW